MYLKGDNPHQAVMIVYECIWFSHISNLHNMRHLCTLAMFHTQHANSLLLLIHVQVQCDLAMIRNTCVNICSLNCLNLFLKYKNWLDLFNACVCVCVYVCVFGSMNVLHLCWVEFWELNMLFGSLVELLACCIYFLVFLPPWKTPFLQAWQLLDKSSKDSFLSSLSFSFLDPQHILSPLRNFPVLFAFSIAFQQLLDPSRFLGFFSVEPRQLLDPSRFLGSYSTAFSIHQAKFLCSLSAR